MGSVSNLEELPPELLERITTFLDPQTLAASLAPVSRLWHRILKDDGYWRRRLQRRHAGLRLCPSLLRSPSFSWVATTAAIEREASRWQGRQGVQPPVTIRGVHFSSVDALSIFGKGRFLLSGSRDRSLALWDLDRLANHSATEDPAQTGILTLKPMAHSGWIWSIWNESEDSFYSSGFDSHIRQWKIGWSEIKAVSSVHGGAAVLAVTGLDSLLMAATYDHRLTLYDPKSAFAKVRELKHHSGPVLSIAVSDGPYFWSCSEDKSVRLYDRRMWDSVGGPVKLRRQPMSVSYAAGQVWVSDGGGGVHLMDGTGTELKSLASWRITPTATKVRDVQGSLGCVLCASSDRYVRVLRPGLSKKTWASFGTLPAEPTNIDYCSSSGRMAVALTDNTIGIWGLGDDPNPTSPAQ